MGDMTDIRMSGKRQTAVRKTDRPPEEKNARAARRSAKRRRRNKRIFLFFLIVFTITTVSVLSTTTFFFITDITVEGNAKYTAGEIVDKSGIRAGENLIRTDTAQAVRNIRDGMPYISSVKIKKNLPSRVSITVEETEAAFFTAAEEKAFLCDANGKILETGDGQAFLGSGYPLVTGLEAHFQNLGGYIFEKDDNKGQYLFDILTGLKDNNMVDTVSQIDLGDVYSLGFRYSEKLYVALGNGQSVADKIRMAWEIIRLLHETSAGTIDVSDPSKGYFKPGK